MREKVKWWRSTVVLRKYDGGECRMVEKYNLEKVQ